MPTRRIMALMICTIVLVRPVFGATKLWATRTLAETPEGTPVHAAAEIATVVLG